MNAIVSYDDRKQNKINYNDSRIFLSRDISALGLFEGMNFINCKRGFIQKIGDHFFSALSYGSLIKKTISRISMRQLEQMLRLAGGIDRAIKGLRQGAPWDELTTLILALCGVRPVNAKNLRISLQ